MMWLVGMSLGESLGEITGLLLVFIFILVMAWLVTRWIAKQQAGQQTSGSIHVIETYRMAPNRYLQIVRIGNKYLVLAVTKDQITLITELSEEEIPHPTDAPISAVPFQDILKKTADVLHRDKSKSKETK